MEAAHHVYTADIDAARATFHSPVDPFAFVLMARRFRCSAPACKRVIFTERLADGAVLPWARRTARLDLLVFHLGLALGGRPAARFSRRLMTPVSNDTLLRVVRRWGRPSFAAPNVIGIDDWAWRRNHRYGTIICDLERRKPIRLLPDREPATACAWLMRQTQITTLARDRGGAYALAAAKALPGATQVADRWHLMENASRAFLDAGRTCIDAPDPGSDRRDRRQSRSPERCGASSI